MKRSDSFQKLMTALGALQSECIKIRKDSTNPHFKSKYASLAVILDEIQPVLTKYKLSYTQLPEAGKLTTILMHTESAEYLETEYDLNAIQNTPQAIGSAITYARRYSLTATLGLNIDDDDDGNAASEPAKSKNTAQSTPPQSPFLQTYTEPKAIYGVVAICATKKDVIDLFNSNKELINKDTNLQSELKKKQLQIENAGKVIITDDQFKKVCARITNGQLPAYEKANNIYLLNENQKAELKKLFEHVSKVEAAIATRGLTDVDIAAILNDCTNTNQVMKLHQNNSMIIDRDTNLLKLVNNRLSVLKAAA